MDPIKDLKAESELAFDVQLQKQNLLEACRARQVMAHDGGLFLVDESLISFLKSLKDLDVTDTVIGQEPKSYQSSCGRTAGSQSGEISGSG